MLAVGELDPIVGKDDVDLVGQRLDDVAQKLRRNHLAGFLMQFQVGKLRRAVDGNK